MSGQEQTKKAPKTNEKQYQGNLIESLILSVDEAISRDNGYETEEEFLRRTR